jgi:undecaprenyl-diphosphatase
MVGILESVFLGIVQGISEWLPVSSKGNVAMLATFFGANPKTAFSFAVLLHIGTLIAATIFFRKELLGLLEKKNRGLLKFVFITLACTAITAFPTYFLLKKILEAEEFYFFGLVFGSATVFALVIGFFLVITGLLQLKKKKTTKEELSEKNAAMLGLAQGFTALPGLSRSGTTTSVLLFEGFSPARAFELSFFVSVPTVLFAELSFGFLEKPVFDFNVAVGIIVAAIVGYFSIGLLLNIAKKINFGKFCLVLGALYMLIGIVSVALPNIV